MSSEIPSSHFKDKCSTDFEDGNQPAGGEIATKLIASYTIQKRIIILLLVMNDINVAPISCILSSPPTDGKYRGPCHSMTCNI